MMPERPEMPTLVLRNVPEDLYLRLKETAAEHRRSMTQEAIVWLGAALDGRADVSARLDLDATLDWLRREVWSLPSIERRDDDAILGYNADGHFD
jgi:plasmid stability protein